MKVTFFLGEFPVPSETFVINQINGLVELGVDVQILALKQGRLAPSTASLTKFDLLSKTIYLLNEAPDDSRGKHLTNRIITTIKHLFNKPVLSSLNFTEYGEINKSLLLTAAATSSHLPIKSDVIIAHFGGIGVIANSLKTLGLLKGDLFTVFHGADISVTKTLNNYKHQYIKLFKQSKATLPISNLWKKKLIEIGCPEDNISVNRMGINISDFISRDIDVPLHSPLNIITVARFMEKKGLFDAISAMKFLKDSGTAFNYKIIGGGELYEQIKQHIADLALENDIELIGFQPQETIKEYLDNADVFLLPSITASNGDMEGIPVALMEAMAVGLITVSTQHSGIPELIEHGVSGFLAAESNPKELSDILKKIAINEIDLIKIRRNALETVSSKFNQKILYKQLLDIISK